MDCKICRLCGGRRRGLTSERDTAEDRVSASRGFAPVRVSASRGFAPDRVSASRGFAPDRNPSKTGRDSASSWYSVEVTDMGYLDERWEYQQLMVGSRKERNILILYCFLSHNLMYYCFLSPFYHSVTPAMSTPGPTSLYF